GRRDTEANRRPGRTEAGADVEDRVAVALYADVEMVRDLRCVDEATEEWHGDLAAVGMTTENESHITLRDLRKAIGIVREDHRRHAGGALLQCEIEIGALRPGIVDPGEIEARTITLDD